MHMNRGLVFWGLALVTAGIVALGVQQGYVDRDALAGAWRLWPLILIALGLSLVLARTPVALLGTIAAALVLGVAGGALISVGPGAVACGGDEPTSLTTQDGAFTTAAAEVDLDFNCGTLEVGLADGSGWSVAAGQRGGREARIDTTDRSLRVRSPEGSFALTDGRQRWEVTLGSALTYELSVDVNAATTVLDLAGAHLASLQVDPNAGSVVLDLGGASVDELGLSLNAGSASISVDSDSAVAGQLDVNAGGVELCTAPRMALRIVVQGNLTFSHNLEESDLIRTGDTWSTERFEDARRQVDLRLEGNAASFTLNPEGGCA